MTTHKTVFFLVFVSFCFHNVKCQRFSLLGPRVISSANDVKVFVYAKDIPPESNVTIQLKAGGQLDPIALPNNWHETGLSQFINIPISKYNSRFDSYELIVEHTNEAKQVSKQSTKLFDVSHHFIVFIQMDKSSYNVGEKVKFRVFALDRKLGAHKFKRMDIEISDSVNVIVEKFKNIESSKFGVYSFSMQLANYPNHGEWKIKVFIDTREKKSESFVVGLGTTETASFEANLQVQKYISYDSRIAVLNLELKSMSRKSIEGSARVKASGLSISDNRSFPINFSKEYQVKSGQNVISIDLQRDMDLNYVRNDIAIEFSAEITDNKTGKELRTSATSTIKYKDSHYIEITKSQFFKPTFKYPIMFEVKNFDGTLDGSYDNLDISIFYTFDNGTVTENLIPKQVRQGKVEIELTPPNSANKIQIKAKFRKTEITTEAHRLQNEINEYMELSIENESIFKIGDQINFIATSSNYLGVLHVMVTYPNGTIEQMEFSEADGRDMHEFPILATEDMQPETSIIAYYVDAYDGVIIHDSKLVKLEMPVKSELNIEIQDTAHPNELVSISSDAEEHSKVFLTAVKIDEVGDINFKNQFIQQVHKSLNIAEINGDSRGFLLTPIIPDGITEKDKLASYEDISLANYDNIAKKKVFSDVWFFDEIKEEENMTLNKEAPNMTATWQISGFSVHPSNGFSFVSSLTKLSVISNLIANIYGPEWIKKGEMVKIDFDVINNLEEPIDVKIEIILNNGKLFKADKVDECVQFEADNNEYSKSLQLPANSASDLNSIFIKDKGDPSIEIVLNVIFGNDKYTAKKNIEIRMNDNSFTNNTMTSIDYLKRSLSIPMQYIDQKIHKFSGSVLLYTCLSKQNSNDESETALAEMKTDYQEIVRIWHSLQKKPNIKLIAQLSEALLDAKEFIEIDDRFIIQLLDYIKTKQDENGHFKYDANEDSRRDIGAIGQQRTIQTALVILPFLKDDKLKKNYKDVVEKAINKLKNDTSSDAYQNDYEKVLVANALMRNDKNANPLQGLQIKEKYKNPLYGKHMTMFFEIVSYLIAVKKKNTESELKWLVNQRYTYGGYFSPYDAILGTKAILDAKKICNIDLNPMKQTKPYLSDFLTVKSEIDLRSNDPLEIKIEITQNTTVLKSKRTSTNLVVVEFDLPSGFKYNSCDEKDYLKQVDVLDSGRFVIFYIDKIEPDKTYSLNIKMKQEFEIFKTANSTIKAYDYYRSNVRGEATVSYDINEKNCNKQERDKFDEY